MEAAGWDRGEGALHVALSQTATSLGRERIPVAEAAAVLRSLAGTNKHLLIDVAVEKLRAHHGRGYHDQIDEMRAAAALLLAQ